MKKDLFVAVMAMLVSLCVATKLQAQNLVVDPGFESGTSCTDDFNITPGWDDAGGGGPADTCATPDIFTPCGSVITGIFGSHTPHGGQNYAGAFLAVSAGIGCIGSPVDNGREYIQGTLTQPLVAGQKYCVKFYMALSKRSAWAFNGIGVYFSNTHVVHTYCPGTGANGTLLPFTPQLTYCGPNITDTAQWTELKWTYTATGGEQYFIVGNFNTDANVHPVCANSSAFFPYMYYFYDDFSITAGCCPDSVEFGNISSTGCGGVSNGATASVATTTCGVGTYTYNWSNSTGGQTISNVSNGTYTVTVTTTAGCSATGSITLGAGITVSPTATNSGCSGNTGSASANVTAGTGPFTYSWSNNATTATINNVAAGIYSLTVSNSGGCSVTAKDTVGQSGSIQLTPHATGATCGNSNGSASVTATGASGYTYSWSNSGTAATINNIPGGNYTVTVSATGSCSATASVSVTASANLAISLTTTSTTCGNTNGAVSISITTGTGPFTYSWSNGSTMANLANLNHGTYSVTVSGNGGCSATASALVDTSSAISLTTFSGRAGCTSSGTASVVVNSGNGPFTYSWSNGATASSVNSLSAGNYSVTVTGATSCSASATATVISTGTGVTLSPSATPTGCSGNTGSASVTATTGDSPFTYSWSNGNTTSSINNAAGGNYTVTVTAVDGCSATASVSVTTSGTLSVTTSTTGTTCGNSNGAASVTAGGGTFTYSWSNGATTSAISNLAAASYTVTVIGSPGCSATATAVVNPSGGSVSIDATPNPVCQGDSSQICAPVGYRSYHWNIGDTSHCIYVTQAGNYYVTVTDNANCTATSNHVSITINIPGTVSVTQHGDTLIASGAVSYQWYLNNAPISGATSATYIATHDGTYYVQGTDQNGCNANSGSTVIKTPLGINELADGSTIKVYPNPLANGNWHLDVSSDWVGSNCEVYDAAGRLVFKTEIKNTQSEFELNVAQGIYLLRINSAQKNYAVKLIKL